MHISNNSVERFIERAIEDETGHDVDFIEVEARVEHGDSQIFAVKYYIDGDQKEATVAIDLKVKDE